MKKLGFIFLLLSPAFLVAQSLSNEVDALVSPKTKAHTITVGGDDADIAGFTNQAIQFAIDAVAPTGGTVKLNAGIFKVTAPIRMKSNVDLTGEGKETILKKTEGIQTRFNVDADYGELKLTVENSDGFEIGCALDLLL